MRFENTQVFNFDGALRGMRNPLESWAKSDSILCPGSCDNCDKWRLDWSVCPGNMLKGDFVIGPKDMDLCRRLINGGPEHRKFLRQIFVSVDITAPLYWFKEFDTYRVGVTENSTSTMHKLASTPITLECFETDDFDRQALIEAQAEDVPNHIVYDFIEWLETCRQKYNETKDKRYWKELIRWLPNGWLQTRTVTMNYENLRSMAHQRIGHKLSEWHAFLEWANTLPYAKELIFD